MPIYNYKCHQCDHEIKRLQSFKAVNPLCHYCNLEMDRQIGTPEFKLVGKGFHKKGV